MKVTDIKLTDNTQDFINATHEQRARALEAVGMVAEKYAKMLCLDADAAACCEIIFALCEQCGVTPDQQLASALFTGIVTDTGCFQFTNTTPATHIAAAKLMQCGADNEFITKLFFETKSFHNFP